MTAKLTTRPTPLFLVAHELGHLITDESGPFLEEEAFGG
jgi:Zn-dependent peptidase ImmA (M78 family)